ncbi:MAG: hypothetical protein ACRD5D_00545 [Candidatus Polarisedimenticolia bacterium]
MSIPSYLQGNFRYLQITGVDDVQDIMDAVDLEVLALSPAWTDLGSDEYKSPVDADGRFVKVKMTRIDADTLEILTTDPQARAFTRRMDIANPSVVDIYVGQFHLFVDCSTNGHGFWAAVLDLAPLPQDVHDEYVVGNAKLDATGADDAQYDTKSVQSLNSDGPPRVFEYVQGLAVFGNNLTTAFRSVAGAYRMLPVFVFGEVNPGEFMLRGRLRQTLACHRDLAAGIEKVVPVDEATTGVFRVLALPSGVGANTDFKFMVRKA